MKYSIASADSKIYEALKGISENEDGAFAKLSTEKKILILEQYVQYCESIGDLFGKMKSLDMQKEILALEKKSNSKEAKQIEKGERCYKLINQSWVSPEDMSSEDLRFYLKESALNGEYKAMLGQAEVQNAIQGECSAILK